MKLVKSLGMALGLLAAVPASATYIITGSAIYTNGASANFTIEVPDTYVWFGGSNIFGSGDGYITSAMFAAQGGAPVFDAAEPSLTISIYDSDDVIANGLSGFWTASVNEASIVWFWREDAYIDEDHQYAPPLTHTADCERCEFGFVYRDDGPTHGNVPEPATLALMGLGLAGLGFSRRRKA